MKPCRRYGETAPLGQVGEDGGRYGEHSLILVTARVRYPAATSGKESASAATSARMYNTGGRTSVDAMSSRNA